LQSGWSQGTAKQYRWHLGQWSAWLDVHSVATLEQIDKRRLRQWGASILERWAKATARGAVICVRSFLAWCLSEDLLTTDLSSTLKIPRASRTIQRTISPPEVSALLEQAGQWPPAGVTPADAEAIAVRNVAIISLLFDSLIRANELCELRLFDVDLAAGQLVVLGKGGNQRRAMFGQATATRLAAWIGLRQATPGTATFFVGIGGNTPGQPLKPRGLRLILKRIGDRAGIPDVSPHAFRRGGATAAIAQGAPSRVVQQFGGWSNLEMVDRYTQALNAGDLYHLYGPVDHMVPQPVNDWPTRKREP
jgi:integrase/recombinase XerC